MPVRNTLELRILVGRVLDEAIASVAEEEFNRLRRATNDNAQIAANVTAALSSLDKLPKGVEPKYNEWDALFYITWYQPRQINMALKILRRFYEKSRYKHQRAGRPFHVIDVGCGALAVQFAMVLLATECRWKGADVTVIGIDPSEPMRNIGDALWLEFWSNLSNHPNLNKHSELSDLERFCDCMTTNCELFDSHTSYFCSEGGRSWVNPRLERWIMAVHASYESNRFTIKRALQELRDRYSPSAILVTSHRSRWEVVRFVAGEESLQQRPSPKMLPLQGKLTNTTEWRIDLLSKLPAYQTNSLSSLLSNPVEWAPRKHKSTLCKILIGG